MVTGEAADALAGDLADIVDGTGIPVHLCWLAGEEQTREARRRLRQRRIPIHNSVHRLGKAARWASTPIPAPRPSIAEVEPLVLGEVPAAVLSEWQVTDLLAAAGVRTPRGLLVEEPGRAAAAVEAVGGLAVCKLQSGSTLHKTELGLLQLGVLAEEAESVVSKLLAAVDLPDVEGVLVQEQVPSGLELLVGITSTSPGLPPLLTVGLGGVATELLGDVVSDCLPLSSSEVEALLGRLRSAPLLTGFRGRPAYDLTAAVEAIVNLARLAEAFGHRLIELEVNPLIVQPARGGAVAADALVRLRPVDGP
jgi:acetate---CoA ligase (ADP-forming)